MKTSTWVVAGGVACAFFFWTGCSRRSGYGLELPAGNPDRGADTFVAMHCHGCHRVSGWPFAAPVVNPPVPDLGGQVITLPTDGRLLTAVVNPSRHLKIAGGRVSTVGDSETSRMGDYTRLLTAEQLVDLVAFLQTTYERERPQYHPGLF
jgi:mono/diheme cytochrome c family protein